MALQGGDRAEAFLSWADGGAEGMDAELKLFQEGRRPSTTSIWYRDRPSLGWGVGLTYGASLLTNPPIELMILVHSPEPAWAWALAHFVDRHRSQLNGLGIGDTINWHEPVARRSKMDAFLVGPPVGAPDEGIVHLSEVDHVQLLQAFPIYASERALIRELGERAFTERIGDDLLEPRRDPLQ